MAGVYAVPISAGKPMLSYPVIAARPEDIAVTIQPHPTRIEAFRNAAAIALGCSLTRFP